MIITGVVNSIASKRGYPLSLLGANTHIQPVPNTHIQPVPMAGFRAIPSPGASGVILHLLVAKESSRFMIIAELKEEIYKAILGKYWPDNMPPTFIVPINYEQLSIFLANNSINPLSDDPMLCNMIFTPHQDGTTITIDNPPKAKKGFSVTETIYIGILKEYLKDLNSTITGLGLGEATSRFISGGIIQRIIHGQRGGDVDIWFINDEDRAKAINGIDTKRFEIFADPAYLSNVIDNVYVSKGVVIGQTASTVNVINFVFGEPAELIRDRFDFVHCMSYYDASRDKLFISPLALNAIVHKKLIRNTHQKKLSASIQKREQKYKDMGYKYEDCGEVRFE